MFYSNCSGTGQLHLMIDMNDNSFIDVICQHTRDGNIVPLKIRIKDEDGMFQSFAIKSYRELSSCEEQLSPYGTIVHSHLWFFACQIIVIDTRKEIKLFYNARDNLWRLLNGDFHMS